METSKITVSHWPFSQTKTFFGLSNIDTVGHTVHSKFLISSVLKLYCFWSSDICSPLSNNWNSDICSPLSNNWNSDICSPMSNNWSSDICSPMSNNWSSDICSPLSNNWSSDIYSTHQWCGNSQSCRTLSDKSKLNCIQSTCIWGAGQECRK